MKSCLQSFIRQSTSLVKAFPLGLCSLFPGSKKNHQASTFWEFTFIYNGSLKTTKRRPEVLTALQKSAKLKAILQQHHCFDAMSAK